MKTKKSKSPLALIYRVAVISRADGDMLVRVRYLVGELGVVSRMAVASKLEKLINAAVKKVNGNAN